MFLCTSSCVQRIILIGCEGTFQKNKLGFDENPVTIVYLELFILEVERAQFLQAQA